MNWINWLCVLVHTAREIYGAMRPSTGATGTILTVLHNSDFRTIWYVGSLGEVGRRMELLVLSWLRDHAWASGA